MHVVAIAELAGPFATEAAALAAELKTTAYEEGLNLKCGLPTVVLATSNGDRACELLDRIEGRGHRVVSCEASALVSSASMISLRRFALDEDAVAAGEPSEERLPYGEIAALLRATHRRHIETQVEVTEKKFSLGRALATSGLMMSKTVTREVRSSTDESEDVLYLFRRDGGTPWILRENSTHYNALGSDVTPAAHNNFLTTIARLRALSPRAAYDERLLAFRGVPARAQQAAATAPALHACPDGGYDLLAYLLALSIAD